MQGQYYLTGVRFCICDVWVFGLALDVDGGGGWLEDEGLLATEEFFHQPAARC
jgi:hypothetical protein